MKLHDGIMEWHGRSEQEISNSIIKCEKPNIIMCSLVMDSLNEVMPKKLLNDASEAKIKEANNALKNALNSEVQPSNNEAINNLPQTKVLKFTKSVQYFANDAQIALW